MIILKSILDKVLLNDTLSVKCKLIYFKPFNIETNVKDGFIISHKRLAISPCFMGIMLPILLYVRIHKHLFVMLLVTVKRLFLIEWSQFIKIFILLEKPSKIGQISYYVINIYKTKKYSRSSFKYYLKRRFLYQYYQRN